MMARCIALSRDGIKVGELPFARVIAWGVEILGQSSNRVVRDGDPSRHAEIVAIVQARGRADRHGLGDCTL